MASVTVNRGGKPLNKQEKEPVAKHSAPEKDLPHESTHAAESPNPANEKGIRQEIVELIDRVKAGEYRVGTNDRHIAGGLISYDFAEDGMMNIHFMARNMRSPDGPYLRNNARRHVCINVNSGLDADRIVRVVGDMCAGVAG